MLIFTDLEYIEAMFERTGIQYTKQQIILHRPDEKRWSLVTDHIQYSFTDEGTLIEIRNNLEER